MESKREAEVGSLTGPVKMEAAALMLGAPFYAVVVIILLQGAAQLGALALYGGAAGAWVAWRARRALRSGQG